MNETVLVGRTRELAAVRSALRAAGAGAGALVLITGEAGVGKSRLVEAATRTAREWGMAILTGRSVEGGGPYRPVAEALYGWLRERPLPDTEALRPFRPALARLLPGTLPAGPVPGVDPLVVLGEGVLRLLAELAGDGGALLVLEDLHWADRDTLALLEYLVPALGGVPVAAVASARSDEEPPETLRRLAARPEIVGVPLARLGPEDAARLASARAGGVALPAEVVDHVVRLADGLPFLVEELLSGARASTGPEPAAIPATLAELVRRRLARLAPAHRQVAEAAAVLGARVDWAVLAPVTGLAEDDVVAGLRAAVDGYLLEPDGDRFGWRHALMRDAVLAQLLAPQRVRLARRAADVLLAADPELTGPDAAFIADLYARGGCPDVAGRLLVRLARRAVATGAPGSAGELLDRAVALGVGTAAVVERVRLLTVTGRAADALEAGAPALVGAGGAERVDLLLNLARAAVTAGRWADADGYLRRIGHPGGPRVDAIAADAAFGAGRVEEANALATAAAEAAVRDGPAEVACEALQVAARCARQAHPSAAAAVFRRAADLAEEHGLVTWRIRALFGVGTVELQADRPATLERVRELALDAGMLAEVAAADLLVADLRACVDGPAAALALARRSATLAGQVRLDQIAAMAWVACAEGHAVAAHTDDMRAALETAKSLASGGAAASGAGTTAADVASAMLAAEATPAVLDGDLPRARDLLDDAIDRVRRHGSAAPLRHWGLWAVLRTVLDDRAEQARDQLRHAPVRLRAVNRGALHYADAVAAGRAGDPVGAVALFAAGDAALDHLHWWRRLLRLQVLSAALADGWEDPVAQLRRDLTDQADPRLARLARDLLRRAGAPVPRKGRGDSRVPARLRAIGVTSREMDVLALVAQGLTNAQVAERLYLSRRTVETHVASLLAKTGAANRADLARRSNG